MTSPGSKVAPRLSRRPRPAVGGVPFETGTGLTSGHEGVEYLEALFEMTPPTAGRAPAGRQCYPSSIEQQRVDFYADEPRGADRLTRLARV